MTNHTLSSLLDEKAAQNADREIFRFEGQSLSLAELQSRSHRIARHLTAAGIAKGDRVAVMLPNGFDFPVSWFAIARVGAVIVPVNTQYREKDLGYILTDSEAKLLISSTAFLAAIDDTLPDVPQSVAVALIDAGDALSVNAIDLADEPEVETCPDIEISPDDLLNLQYTSGTTGFPKGCMLTHAYWLTLAQVAMEVNKVEESDVILTAQPFYYADPQWNTVLALAADVPLVIMPKFSASRFMETVRRERVTFFYCIGTMPVMLFKQPEHKDDRNNRLRVVYCSGIPPTLHQAFEDRWGAPWREVFGMTETGVDLAVPITEEKTIGSGIVGRAVRGKTISIVMRDGAEADPGEIGELCVSGRPMMLGYWNNAKATAATMKDGWLHTGDLASIDENGWVRLQGRIKDMIRRGGENIAASEVEAVIAKHPAVAEVAVGPVADEIRGEEVAAYILPRNDTDFDPYILMEWLRPQLASFKLPRLICIVNAFPKTPSERVEKHKLVEPGNPYVKRVIDLARNDAAHMQSVEGKPA